MPSATTMFRAYKALEGYNKASHLDEEAARSHSISGLLLDLRACDCVKERGEEGQKKEGVSA